MNQLWILPLLIVNYAFVSSFISIGNKNLQRFRLNNSNEPIGLVTKYTEIKVPTLLGIHFSNLTPQLNQFIKDTGVKEGVLTVISRHTTSAITINEMEPRLVDDTRQFLLKLVPAAYPYLHNDLHLRDGPPDWPGGNEAWRAQGL